MSAFVYLSAFAIGAILAAAGTCFLVACLLPAPFIPSDDDEVYGDIPFLRDKEGE